MREMKARGRRLLSTQRDPECGDWIYGIPVFYGDGIFIANPKLHSQYGQDWRIQAVEGCPDTVGWGTGLTANGVEIYEGDIVKDADSGSYGAVVWSNDKHWGYLFDTRPDHGWNHPTKGFQRDHLEVIGNIHENASLLEGNDEGNL